MRLTQADIEAIEERARTGGYFAADGDIKREYLKRISDRGIRHKTGVTTDDYLTSFLEVGRMFAFATPDDSWGEFEKLFHIMALALYDRTKAMTSDGDIPALLTEIKALQAENEKLEKLVYVPGLLKCAKCGFTLISNTLNVATGQVGAKNEPEQCLNGCGPMWRVSERQAGYDRMLKATKKENS